MRAATSVQLQQPHCTVIGDWASQDFLGSVDKLVSIVRQASLDAACIQHEQCLGQHYLAMDERCQAPLE